MEYEKKNQTTFILTWIMIHFPNILKRKEKLKIRWLRIMSYGKAHLGKKHQLLLAYRHKVYCP